MQVKNINAEANQESLVLRLPIAENAYVEYIYSIKPDDYMIGFDVRFVGLEQMMRGVSNFTVDWSNTSLQNENGFKNANRYTSVVYRTPDE